MRKLLAFFIATAALGLAGAKADAFTFSFTTVVAGDTPSGSDWATLDVTDGGLDTVNFTLSHNATSASGQFITQLFLNSSLLPGDLVGSFGPAITGITWGYDFTTNVANMFDMIVDFKFVPVDERFVAGQSVSWSMTGTGLTASNFFSLSTPVDGVPPMLGLLRIQGTDGPEGSSKLAPVPEPGSMLALAIGAVAVMARRRRKANSTI